MNKKQIQQRVLQNGQPLDLNKFNWGEKTRTFSSDENDLVLDFKDVNFINFITGSNCIFDTGHNCTFNTGFNCTFKTGSDCTFNTGSNCTFNTEFNCTFDTSFDCTFKTGSSCIFITGWDCTFNTSYNCVIVRRDIFEVIQPKENVKIKLNEHQVKGFKIIKKTKTITIDGKDIEISNESFENLKKQLN